jgi:hypothetical protein
MDTVKLQEAGWRDAESTVACPVLVRLQTRQTIVGSEQDDSFERWQVSLRIAERKSCA